MTQTGAPVTVTATEIGSPILFWMPFGPATPASVSDVVAVSPAFATHRVLGALTERVAKVRFDFLPFPPGHWMAGDSLGETPATAVLALAAVTAYVWPLLSELAQWLSSAAVKLAAGP